MSLLIQGGLLNQTAGSDKGSRNLESVQSVTSSLLDAVLANKVPGEEPVSFQTATIGTLVWPHNGSSSDLVASFSYVAACRGHFVFMCRHFGHSREPGHAAQRDQQQ
jgi:hypothetical protein